MKNEDYHRAKELEQMLKDLNETRSELNQCVNKERVFNNIAPTQLRLTRDVKESNNNVTYEVIDDVDNALRTYCKDALSMAHEIIYAAVEKKIEETETELKALVKDYETHYGYY